MVPAQERPVLALPTGFAVIETGIGGTIRFLSRLP